MASGPRSSALEIDRARATLDDARATVAGSPRMTAREAYLAMFHAAQARIIADGRPVPKTHKGVNVVIGEVYAGSDYPAHKILSEIENWKIAADYWKGRQAERSDAETAIDVAEAFIDRLVADIGDRAPRLTLSPAELAALQRLGREDGH